jgi:3-oxoacyl-[acyl-carrier protein] reductase
MKILVTGASRGIGLAAAREFDEPGNTVYINGRESARLNAVLPLFNGGAEVIPIAADVGDETAVIRMFEKAGEIGVLINNAGIAYNGLFQDMERGDMKKLVDTNIWGVINCSQAAVKGMIKKGKGCIINVSSVWGNSGASCEVVYSMTKGAVDSFTRALAKELAPCGIRVNAVACGVIDTDMNAGFSENERAVLAEAVPMGRFGTAAEAAEVVRFLASDAAGYVTGQVIGVDGGFP